MAPAERSNARFGRSFGQSYPFIELVLIYCEEDRSSRKWRKNSAAPDPIFRFAGCDVFRHRLPQRPDPRAGAGADCGARALVCDSGSGRHSRPIRRRDGGRIFRIERSLGVGAAPGRSLPVVSAKNHRAFDGAPAADGAHRESPPRKAERMDFESLLPDRQSRGFRGHQQDQPDAGNSE